MNRAGKWYIKSGLIQDLMKDNYGEDFWKVKFQEGCWNSVSYSPQKKALTEIYRPFEKKDPKCKEKLNQLITNV